MGYHSQEIESTPKFFLAFCFEEIDLDSCVFVQERLVIFQGFSRGDLHSGPHQSRVLPWVSVSPRCRVGSCLDDLCRMLKVQLKPHKCQWVIFEERQELKSVVKR